MTTDYDVFYRDNPNGLGEPTREFVAFFESYADGPARVLDVGCGQGRDALFIARQGHHVTAVDISPNGIRDLDHAASKEGLAIDAIVGDIRSFEWQGPYDVIVVDRTLHMLSEPDRLDVLQALGEATASKGYLMIADERRNHDAMLERLLARGRWAHNPAATRIPVPAARVARLQRPSSLMKLAFWVSVMRSKSGTSISVTGRSANSGDGLCMAAAMLCSPLPSSEPAMRGVLTVSGQ